jgi:hypothetical protein
VLRTAQDCREQDHKDDNQEPQVENDLAPRRQNHSRNSRPSDNRQWP